MKRKIFTLVTIITLAGCITLSSCVGSFNLTNKVLNWNKNLGNKFVNELVFVALNIIPVYELSILIDAVVINTIEFWTGSNPVQAGLIQEIEGENGKFIVETLENGYSIMNEEGKEMKLLYDVESNIWSTDVDGQVSNIIKIEGDNAIVYLQNGEERNVELTSDGVLAFRQLIDETTFYAFK
jgi:hypothetical protein